MTDQQPQLKPRRRSVRKPFRKPILFASGAIALIAVLGFLLILGLRSDPVITTWDSQDSRKIQNLSGLVEAYLESHGGIENIESAVSMRTWGTIHYPEDEEVIHFTIVKRRPNLYRATFETERTTVTEYFNGEQAWRLVTDNKSGQQQISTVTGQERDHLIRQAEFDSLLVRESRAIDGIRFAGTRSFAGSDFYEIQVVTGDTNQERTILIDQKTMQDVIHLDYLIHEGRTFTVRQQNYKEVRGLKLPHLITREIDGREQWRMAMDRVELNIGITASFFSPESKP